ncbi:MAG: molecular chaperone [Enterobacter ludwigii]|nr:molecular chaperone [Enterobacter ludwigii]
MKRLNRYFAGLLVCTVLITEGASVATLPEGGVVLGSTRLVLTPSARTTSLLIRNGAGRVWLTQVRILDAQERESEKFVVLPPLFRLEAGSEAKVRVTAVGQPEDYPADREAVWYVHALTVPASTQPGHGEGARSELRIGLENVIKLFWRPASLKTPTAEVYRQVAFTSVDGGVKGCNQSRYYLSFDRLVFDGQRVDLNREPAMLSPLACETYKVSARKVGWAMIDDHGGSSEVFTDEVRPAGVVK